MSTKHIFQSSSGLVARSLQGVAAINPALRAHTASKVVYDSASTAALDSIALVAGGGAGHEPAYAGYVGSGMLTAAVSGDIFASPSTRQICTALDLLLASSSSQLSSSAASHKPKVIFIVLQYSGDVLNFGLAKEKAIAAGWDAEVVLVGDDVSVGRAQGGRVGRRGLAAQVFVIKAMGAYLARHTSQSGQPEASTSVQELASFGRTIAQFSATMGVSLDHCHPPGASNEWTPLGPGELGLGVGIHNEPGVQTLRSQPATEELIQKLLKFILDREDQDRAFLDYEGQDHFVLVVNNLGGISPLELNAVVHEALVQLKKEWNISPKRVFAGTYLSSLNAPGFSLSLINLSKITSQQGSLTEGNNVDSLLQLLDDSTTATGWTGSRSIASSPSSVKSAPSADDTFAQIAKLPKRVTGSSPDESGSTAAAGNTYPLRNKARIQSMIQGAISAVVKAEPEITRLDTLQGDGDCGTTLKAMATQVGSSLPAIMEKHAVDASGLIGQIGEVVESSMGGTSGAIYALFFSAMRSSLLTQDSASAAQNDTESPAFWGHHASQALQSLYEFTPARIGDRTLIDALDPFVTTLAESQDLARAVQAAKAGADNTSGMKARLGRAAYVGDGGDDGSPLARDQKVLRDPGAVGVVAILEGLLQGRAN
ncbi:hypothetical protein OC846_003400 [Tilletia horrida]|uniref:Dihydroxyacetone kinase n=1 Tax=Tilletia horrida TaxID=155126 RepID=A0AAN6GPK3_9BASI|nr:hypothetical protein OC845_003225 [Tilletia horrida]KAK0551160.1 hypothetical protein OC846_003400 [Tilletia horrida]KAK0566107.1 hypothetical protein OC861_003401 [Tilletia horrida]